MSEIDESTWNELLRVANSAAESAYAPYSDFHVGAALLTESGDVFAGCNVENATFGATVCAERNAIAAAVLAADTNLQALVVICPADRPVAPCGICRQVLAEFADDLPILLATPDGQRELVNLTELLPHRFGSSDFT